MNNSEQVEPDSKKKIMFDLTFLFDQYAKRGIGVYGKNVLKRLFTQLTQEGGYKIQILGFNSLEENLIELGYSQFAIEENKENFDFFSLGKEKSSGINNFKEWENKYKPILEEARPNIFYAAHFERGLPSVPKLKEKLNFEIKTIVVAHDAIPLVTNKFSAKGPIINFFKKRFFKEMWKGIQNADKIITASNFSKSDIIKYGNVTSEKIDVIYLGVDEKFQKENYTQSEEIQENTLETFSLVGKNYFFYDTGVEQNKGAIHLLKIFKEILNLNSPNLPNYLVITGRDFRKGVGLSIQPKSILGDNFFRLAKKLGVAQNLITTDKISDEQLVDLLFNAKVYLNLSTYEGFGLGIAQAMSAEIPVIAGNASCIPEIAQDGAFLIDLKKDMNYEETAKKIEEYINDKEKVNNTVKKGKKISKTYDWDKTVEQTLKLIKKL